MAVIDAFMFFDELDILDIRLAELGPVVDRFVLVESTTTFRGSPHQPTFGANRERFAAYLSKITHVVVDDLPRLSNPWVAEYVQRNAIRRGLADVAPNDVILITDADEIPRRDVVERLRGLADGEIVALEMPTFYYGLNWIDRSPEIHPRATNARTLSWLTAHEVRTTFPTFGLLDAGWHFSYFYPRHELHDRLKQKAGSFAHREFATPRFLDDAYLAECIAGGLSWCTEPRFNLKFDYQDVDQTYPHLVLEDSSRFSSYRVGPENRDLRAESRARRRHFVVKTQSRMARARRLLRVDRTTESRAVT